MAKIKNEVSINKPVDDVWAVVREFGENRRWSNLLSDSKLDGEVRVCTLGEGSPAPGAVLKERLLQADDRLMRLEYTVTEAPFPVEFHNALLEVYPDQDGSLVVWTTTVAPDELAAAFSPGFDADLQGLKQLVEGE